MFDKIFNVFKQYEQTNDEKFKEFHEFHKWLIETMPAKLKQAYNSGNKIAAAKNKQYEVELSMTDYLWWEAQYEAELIDMKELKTIENDMLLSLVKIIESIKLDEYDKEIWNIIFNKLEEVKQE